MPSPHHTKAKRGSGLTARDLITRRKIRLGLFLGGLLLLGCGLFLGGGLLLGSSRHRVGCGPGKRFRSKDYLIARVDRTIAVGKGCRSGVHLFPTRVRGGYTRTGNGGFSGDVGADGDRW